MIQEKRKNKVLELAEIQNKNDTILINDGSLVNPYLLDFEYVKSFFEKQKS